MEWSSFILGLGGLALGGWTTYLSYKSRTSSYRELLFSKHVEAYAEITAALQLVLEIAYQFIGTKGTNFRLDDTSRPELRQVALPQVRSLHEARRKWAVFLPKQMNEDIDAFMRVFRGVSAPPKVADQYPADIVYAKDPSALLSTAYSRVIATARRGLGIEPLTEETLRMIGGRSPE